MLEEAWPIIAPGLQKVTERGHDPDFTEQVKNGLSTGVAHLFLALDPEYRGFAVIKPEQTLTGTKSLHVWAAYSENANPIDRMAEIEAMALEQGFAQVTFSSARTGWGRRMKDYQPTYQIYRKVLANGR